MAKISVSSHRIMALAFALAIVLLAVYATARFGVASNLGDSWRGATLEQMIDGTAQRPYVQRPLMPVVVGAISSLLPQAWHAPMNEAMMVASRHPVFSVFVDERMSLRLAFEQHDRLYVRLVAMLCMLACLLAYAAALYKLAGALFAQSWAMALATPIVGLLAAVSLAYPVIYIYDPAVLFLSAACFYALAAARWRWFYLWFTLACINKETACFIFILFSLYYARRMDFGVFLRHWLAQLVIFTVIRSAISLHYANNPGVFLVTDQLHEQLITLLGGFSHTALIGYLAMVFLLTFRWAQKPLLARQGLWIFAMLLVAYVFFGNANEYRVFYDIVPLLAVLVTHTLVETTGLARLAIFACPSRTPCLK